MPGLPLTQLALLGAAATLTTVGMAVAVVQAERAERAAGGADDTTVAQAAERLEAWRELLARAATGADVPSDALERAGVDADARSVGDLLAAVASMGPDSAGNVEVRYTLDAVHAEKDGRVRAEATLRCGDGTGRVGGAGGTEKRLLTFVRDGEGLRLVGDSDIGKGNGGRTPHNASRHRAR